MQMLRITSYSDFDALTTYRAFFNEHNRRMYDDKTEECRMAECLGPNLHVSYQSTVRALGVAPWDLY